MSKDFETYILSRLEKYDMNPSALALSYYYVGGMGRFTELRSQAEYFRKTYYSTISKTKQGI